MSIENGNVLDAPSITSPSERTPEHEATHLWQPLGTKNLVRDLSSRFVLVGVWVLLIFTYALVVPHFFQVSTFRSVFSGSEDLVFLAMAVLCTLIVGEIDLSVASLLGLSATITVAMPVLHGWNVAAASILAFFVVVAAGAINGVIVVKVGVNPIITTLGSGTLFIGIALAISGDNSIGGLSRTFGKIANQSVLALPISFWYGIAIALIFAYILGFTPLGRRVLFVGSNPKAAELSGLNVARLRFGAFVMSGVICGLGGVLVAANLGGYNAAGATADLLPGFAAAFLSVAVIQPGKFNPIGALIGIYFLQTGIIGLQILGYQNWVISVFYGGALVVAVSISTFVARHRKL